MAHGRRSSGWMTSCGSSRHPPCWPTSSNSWAPPASDSSASPGTRAPGKSGVAGLEQVTGDDQQHGGPQAEHAEAFPGREHLIGLLVRLADQLARLSGQIRVHVLADLPRNQLGQRSQHQHKGDHSGNGSGGVPDDPAEPHREQAEHAQVQAGANHRPGYPGVAERHGRVAVQDGRAEEERRERDYPADDQHQHGEDQRLGRQHRSSPGHRQQRRPDDAGRVFARDDQHTQDANGQLAELKPRPEDRAHRVGPDLRARCRTALVPLQDGEPGEQAGEAEGDHDEQDQRPDGRAHRPDLRPLRQQQAAEPCGAGHGRGAGSTGPGGLHRRAGGGHSVLPWAVAGAGSLLAGWAPGAGGLAAGSPYSRLSAVSSMYASSSEASRGVSSCSTMLSAAAICPIRGASRLLTRRAGAWPSAVFSGSALPPAAATRPARVAASGERTSTYFSELRSMKSCVLVSASSLPRPITIRWSAVTAISFIRWLDTKTVRPSLASCFIRFLIHRMPSGSSPLTGSSRMRICGSPSSATAMPTRWLIPSEKPPVRLRATSVSPTSPRTWSTRDRGRPWVWARKSRGLYALRPVCMARASSRAPTVRSGWAMSA